MINNSKDIVADSIFVLYGTEKICTYHWRKLEKIHVYINYYTKSKKNRKFVGTLKIEAYICDECSTIFITREMFESLKNDMSEYHINFKGNIHNNGRYVKNNSPKNMTNNLELDSFGYSAKLSRKTRWNILTSKVIPSIGIYKTVEQIKYFIDYNIMANDRDDFILEWSFDLNRLKDLDLNKRNIDKKL